MWSLSMVCAARPTAGHLALRSGLYLLRAGFVVCGACQRLEDKLEKQRADVAMADGKVQDKLGNAQEGCSPL